MEANELRIGNLLTPLWAENEIAKVIGIDEEYIYSNVISFDYTDYTQYEPIPLDEEWVLKFGFIFENKKDRYGWYLDLESRSLNWCPNFIGLALTSPNYYDFQDYLFEFPCKYVHQLQNLYFALTNKELTIK